MAINFNDLKVEGYKRSPQPISSSSLSSKTVDQKLDDLRAYIEEELRRIEKSIATLVLAAPQVAIKEPDVKMIGMVRQAKMPWNPLGTGVDTYVKWTGSSWVAL
jgi:hypothetical protein